MVISILPPPKKFAMSSDDEIAKLEVQLCQAQAGKARWDAGMKVEVECKAVEEQQIAKEKVAAEVK